MEMRLEARIARDALAWACLAGGVIWLATALGLRVSPPAEDGTGGYLRGVLARSLVKPYQAVLLAGLVAVPLHGFWTLALRGRDRAARDAYDAFGQWAQVLFTSLGFLGTIIGVSLAVGGLESAMQTNDPGALVSGLSTAFDTTFLGLFAAILLMALRKIALWSAVTP